MLAISAGMLLIMGILFVENKLTQILYEGSNELMLFAFDYAQGLENEHI